MVGANTLLLLTVAQILHSACVAAHFRHNLWVGEAGRTQELVDISLVSCTTSLFELSETGWSLLPLQPVALPVGSSPRLGSFGMTGPFVLALERYSAKLRTVNGDYMSQE